MRRRMNWLAVVCVFAAVGPAESVHAGRDDGDGGALASVQIVRVNLGPGSVQTNDNSNDPDISMDGRYVVFSSDATNLVPGDVHVNRDVYIRDLQLGTTVRMSHSPTGDEGNGNSNAPSISADGRYTAFVSDSSNLVSGDTNGRRDVFVFDRATGSLVRINLAPGGAQANDNSNDPQISANGRYVTFSSDASNLVAGDTNGRRDIFVADLVAGTLTRENLAADASQVTDNSNAPSLSSDGDRLAFNSDASTLVAGDTNGRRDIFVATREVVDDEVFANGFE